MASSLKYLGRKPVSVKLAGKSIKFPAKDWKGKGHYYHRSGEWSKYSKSRDMHRTEPTRKPGLAGKWAHVHDSKTVWRGKGLMKKRVGKL